MKLLKLFVIAFVAVGARGCGRQAEPATPVPVEEGERSRQNTVTNHRLRKRPCLILDRNIRFELIMPHTAGGQENAWATGGGINWGHVAPGGTGSSSRRGSTGSTSTTSSSSNSGSGGGTSTSTNITPPTSPQPVSRSELRSLSEELLRLDTNSVGSLVTISPQGRTRSGSPIDKASQNLFSSVPARALSGPTFSTLVALLDNYEASVLRPERETNQEKQEQNAFLDAVMDTAIMQKTEEFLRSKGLITSPLKNVLREIWFTTYPRSRRTLGSSGFEHVFVGETKNGEVTGFHNWVNFYRQEQLGHLDYFGHMNTVDLGDQNQIILLTFKWADETKPFGSMFVGTPPELDMALFTVCFYARPGQNCPVELNGHRFNIKTYFQTYRGKKYVGTAFPNI